VSFIQAGSPRPLGAAWTKRGVNFALFSSHATRVELCLFDAGTGSELARYDLPARTADVWHGLISPRRAGPEHCTRFASMDRMSPRTAIASMQRWP